MRYIPILLLTAACAQVDNEPDPVGISDQCGASGYQNLVGQSRDVLAAMTFPAPVRVIGPNEAVTLDFNPQRLNIFYDRAGRVARVYCG